MKKIFSVIFMAMFFFAVNKSASAQIMSLPGFTKVSETTMNVPVSYKHSKQLRKFNHRFCLDQWSVCLNMNDNTASAQDELIPGESYKVSFFRVDSGTTMHSCADFIQKNGGLFVGAQGLSLAVELLDRSYTNDHWIYSPRSADASVYVPVFFRFADWEKTVMFGYSELGITVTPSREQLMLVQEK